MRRYLALVVLVAGCATAPQPRTSAQEWAYSNVKACEQDLGVKVWLSNVEADGRFTLDGNSTVVLGESAIAIAAALGVQLTTDPTGRVMQCMLRRQFDECERATGHKVSPKSISDDARSDDATSRPFRQCLNAKFRWQLR